MRLEIYITESCANCEEARLIAEHARGIAGLEVALNDLGMPVQPVPHTLSLRRHICWTGRSYRWETQA